MSRYSVVCYTREQMEDAIYAAKLADSMHIALIEDGRAVELNHNSGVLFAKAVWQEDGTMCAKSLKNPWLFPLKDGGYGVIAERIDADGSDDETSKGCVLYYKTEDMLSYTSDKLIRLSDDYINDAVCEYSDEAAAYILTWKDNAGKCYSIKVSDIEDIAADSSGSTCKDAAGIFDAPEEVIACMQDIAGAKPRNEVVVSDELAHRLKCKLIVPQNIRIEVPEDITVSSKDELDKIKVKLLYSDGTSGYRYVKWYTDGIDFGRPGTYEIEGLVKQNHYEFPIAFNRADPCIGKWNGRYYFIATNDADHEHTLYMREADSIPGLVTAQEVLILDAYTYPHIGNLLWAPEFHIIKDKLYIFHAATPQHFEDEQSHIMALKEGGNPMKKSDWEMPRRVVRKDGSPLFTGGITLDMTCFEVDGHYYVVWSQRQFVPNDLGAWLYISEIDPDEPWRLTADPVMLSAPEFGWANNHTFVDEGPYALIRDGKIFLTFSGAAVDSTYVVGLLTADIGADLLNPESWVKTNYPLLTSRSVEGQFGTGHNAYVCDDDGEYWNTYHGRPGVDAPRCTGIRRVHFDIDGYPVLDMTEDKDLAPELKNIKATVRVQ